MSPRTKSQVDLDYTGAGGKRDKTEEGKEIPGAIIGESDLLVLEETTGGETGTPMRRSKRLTDKQC